VAGDAPVISGATGAPFGADPAPDLLAALVQPVRFAAALRAADPTLALEIGPGRTLVTLAPATLPGVRAVPLDPRPGGDGPWRSAAALLAAGHPGLAGALGASAMAEAPRRPAPAPTRREAPSPPPAPAPVTPTPAPVTPAPRPASSRPDRSALRARAEAVQDLRIAALADPALEGAWRSARAALLADLAAADAADAAARGTVPSDPAPVTPPQPPPPVAEPPPTPEPTPEEDLRAAVVGAICEVTGYPADFLDEGADLEADLGVDSIRKMEILGLLQERLEFASAEADYAELSQASLGDLVAYVRRRRGTGDAPAEAPTARAIGAWVLAPLRFAEAPATEAPLPESGEAACRGEHLLWRPAAGDTPDAVRAVVEEGLRLARAHPEARRLTVVFAEGSVAGRAAAAFARSLAREREGTARAIRVVPGTPEARIAAEADAPDRPARVRLGPARTEALHLLPADLDPPDLPEAPVVLATGGVRGIVLPCLAALADRAPRVVLLGRTPPDEQAAARLDALREAGVQVAWRRCDVTDAEAVREAAAWARATHGRIDVVLHAAGVLADGPAERVDTADAARVLEPKLTGAANLHAATAEDRPALWVAFSSLVAHTGNAGQTVYAAANAALEAMAHPTAARSLALAWTAWSGVGMASSSGFGRLLAARGIASISPEAGGRAFRAALGTTGTLAVAADPPEAPALPWPLHEVIAVAPGRRGRFRVALDPSQPALDDHRVGGRPLVPAALWLTTLLAAARATRSRGGPWALEGFAIHAPTFVEGPRTCEVAVDGEQVRVIVRDTVVAEARVVPCAPPEAAPPPEALRTARSAAPLYREDLLFHGPTWRVLDRVEGDGDGGVRADVRAARGLGTTEAALDAAHQVLSAWAGRATGWLGLPVGAGRWIVAGDDAGGPLRLEASARTDGDGVLGEVRIVAADGRVVVTGRDVRLHRAARWPADAPDALEAS